MRFWIFIAVMTQSVAGFSQTYNTVKTWVAQKPIGTEADIISSSHSVQAVVQGTRFVDGFGRPVQSVTKQISPLLQDAVSMHVYDTWGRETQLYLPFISGNDGAFKSNGQSLQTTFNQGLYPGETNFYSQKDFENSPQNRITKNYAPGSSWAGNNRGSAARSVVNTVTDNVRIWNIAATPGSLPTNASSYADGQLYKTIVTDEKGLQAIEYTDKDGYVILKKVQTSGAIDAGAGSPHLGWLCTYYVYDDYGNMRFIITPKVVALIDGTWTVSQTEADELCYRFEYDDYNRLIIRKNPGTPTSSFAEVWTIYDQRNRIVMIQDGNLRSNQKWQYFQYDTQDRPTVTGLMTDPANFNNRGYHQGLAATQINYPNPASYSPEVLSQTWYDNYDWVAGTGSGLGSTLDASNTSNTAFFYAASNSTAPYPQAIVQSPMTRGMVTGSKTEVLESGGTQYLYTVNFYDDAGRIIQTQGTNLSGAGAIDKATTQYSWTGTALRVYEQHSKNGAASQAHNVLTKMTYDHAWRLLSVVKNISSTVSGNPVNSGDKTIAVYSYNETGQVKSKILGTSLETLNYDYNVRGWLTGINKNYTIAGNTGSWFGMELGYDKTATAAGTTSFLYPEYNGNIGGQVWRTKGDGVPRKYDFSYDNINQLTGAAFLQNTSSSSWDKTHIDFSVNSMSYDENGNVKTLNQNGFVLGGTPNIDNLSYAYMNSNSSNRLQNVIDNANITTSRLGDFHYAATSKAPSVVDYSYDNNGNLTSDVNKNITSISYNTLNLPNVITFSRGTITYQYDAAGNKLKKIVQENGAIVPLGTVNYTTDITTTTTYIGGFVYHSKLFGNAALASLNQPEGLLFTSHEDGRSRLKPLASGYSWVFDYYIRDHVGNVRMTLTDETHEDYYPAATLETAGMSTEETFYNITNDANHVITMSGEPWYSSVSGNSYSNNSNNGLAAPPDATVNPTQSSTKMYKLNGATGDRFGLGIALKVMAGDAIQVYGRSLWHSNGTTVDNTSHLVSGVLSTFINAFAGTNAVVAGSKGTANGTLLNGNIPTTGNLSPILNSSPTPGSSPRANICWVLFDEQFKPVQTGSGFDPISTTADAFKPHALSVTAAKSGYLYVYCSNESNQDVYFDNFQVVHTRGPLLNEAHYYPQGLTMFGLISRAYGKLQTNFGYQGKDLQGNEFYDGNGLEQYDFEARYYDQQLARWHTHDPASQFANPYLAMANSWPRGTDPDGKWFGVDDVVALAVGFVVGYVSYGLTTDKWGGKALLSGVTGAVIAEVGYLTLGGGLAITSQSSAGFAGSMAAAKSFSASYAFSNSTTLLQNRQQLSAASDWQAFGLIAGYSAISSISTGLNSSHSEMKMDQFFGIARDASNRFATSDAAASLISTAGNLSLKSFDPRTNDWNVRWGNLTARALLQGYLGGYVGQLAENDYQDNGYNINFFKNKVLTEGISLPKVANVVAQQLNFWFWEWVLPSYK